MKLDLSFVLGWDGSEETLTFESVGQMKKERKLRKDRHMLEAETKQRKSTPPLGRIFSDGNMHSVKRGD